jgi:hypothetical protein
LRNKHTHKHVPLFMSPWKETHNNVHNTPTTHTLVADTLPNSPRSLRDFGLGRGVSFDTNNYLTTPTITTRTPTAFVRATSKTYTHKNTPLPKTSSSTISGTLTSLFKVLFIFPSRYLFAIGLSHVFSFGWNLPPSWSCIPKQLDSSETRRTPRVPSHRRDSHPPWHRLPTDFDSARKLGYAPLPHNATVRRDRGFLR